MNKTAAEIADDVLEKLAYGLKDARKSYYDLFAGKSSFPAMQGELAKRFNAMSRYRDLDVGRIPKGISDIRNLTKKDVWPSFAAQKSDAAVRNAYKKNPHIEIWGDAAKRWRSLPVPPDRTGVTLEDKMNKLTSRQREMLNRLVGGHERSEMAAIRKKDLKSPKIQDIMAFSGHTSPRVLLEDSNRLATLPSEFYPVQDVVVHGRTGNVLDWGILDEIRQVRPDFDFGKTRLNRHSIKRILQALK